jgi:membrane protein YdbS with pleckstrin-like domain
MTDTRSESAPAANRPGLLTATKAVSVLYAALVLVQAIIAGRGWFKNFDLIEPHGQIGDGVFLVAIGLAVLAFMVFGARSWYSIAGAVLVVLTAIQLMLGYSSTEGSGNATAASLHIPNGVLIFGISTAFASSVLRVR